MCDCSRTQGLICIRQGLCPDHIAKSLLPKLVVSNESKMAEFAAGTLWHLEFNRLRPHKGLSGLCACAHCHSIVGLHLLQAFLVFLGKSTFSIFLRGPCEQDFSMPLLCHLRDYLCGMVLGYGHVCTVTCGSRSAWDRKRKQNVHFRSHSLVRT